MQLEISNIKNDLLKAIAKKIDNGNNIIEGQEIEIFEREAKKAIKQNLLSEEDFKETMGLFYKPIKDIKEEVLTYIAKENYIDNNYTLMGSEEINGFYQESLKAADSKLVTESQLKENLTGMYKGKHSLANWISAGIGAVAGLLLGNKAGVEITHPSYRLARDTGKSNLFWKVAEHTEFYEYPTRTISYNSFNRTTLGNVVRHGLPILGLTLAGFGLYKGVKALLEHQRKQNSPISA